MKTAKIALVLSLASQPASARLRQEREAARNDHLGMIQKFYKKDGMNRIDNATKR